ncbi:MULTISPECIES: TetR/AcrR family transcriptional regulator [unclassified Paenibacillus]|uniref:TetR/AcrR family transcriptional regulator n=1 Tax=unclassified Paenibacillus TaxID=185978 RepID=UPI001053AE03|nr:MULTISPECIES: TetR/AcrR family transcriptional regulator [unclassified Paenibacillus]NIK68520.1 AcrR family transcriptional regulator [Paenibacillus sp. BK720]TCM99193.1 TetR family transcriptional regulator [Paenibacillus sp. BK033]
MSEPIEEWLDELNKLGDEKSMTDKQLKIVRAASEIFAEKGFAASSTSEIAQRAGVAEGTIFRHYKTKKELLVSIVAPVMAKLVAPFVMREFYKVLDGKYDSYDQMLRAILENRLAFLEKHLNVLKIFIQEIPFHPELQEQFEKLILAKVFEKVTPNIRRFQEEGSLVDWSPYTIIRLTVSSLIGYAAVRTLYGKREGSSWNDEQEREATIAFIMKGLTP